MTLEAVWFVLVAASLAAYVALDGFDLGVGIVHRFVAKSAGERRLAMATIGPVWDGNEVWLLAAGATLFLAFPGAYALLVGGFFLPVQMLLWLYLGRALGIEMKHHQLPGPLWGELWDTVFALSSLAIAGILGVALANVVRGVTFAEDGTFFAPLWTNFGLSEPRGLLDVYTVLVGLTAAAGLALHGALWLAHRTEGPVADRSRRLSGGLLPLTAGLAIATSAATFAVQPLALAALVTRPLTLLCPVAAAASLALAAHRLARGDARSAFRCSTGFLVGMVGSAAATLYPYVLPGAAPGTGLTAQASAASRYSLGVALFWWIPGIALAASYFVRTYRRLPARLRPEDVEDHP